MVIDDDSNIRQMLQIGLGKYYDVTCFSSGEDINELVESYRPRLLILDINLPGPDGFKICESIRSRNAFAERPFRSSDPFHYRQERQPEFHHRIESGGGFLHDEAV